MRIRLINFRCYVDKTFEFEDNGLVLISAESGHGKTTILLGIQFALYGTGTKLQNFGKTSCSVELEFGDVHILRTKRPNRLLLNGEYENEVAQGIINKKFGDTFDVTSYISQNALNSFIIMSPTDKLEFLEKFSFKDIDLALVKQKTKNLINDRNEKLIKTISQLETTQKLLEEMEEPELVEFPVKCKKQDQEKFEKNQEIKFKNSEIMIKRNRKLLSDTQMELNDINILNTHKQNIEESIYGLEEKIKENSDYLEELNYTDDKDLNFLKNQLKNLLSKREYFDLKNKFESDSEKLKDMREHELNKYTAELDRLDENLWKDYTKEEIKDLIRETKELLSDSKELTFLQNQLEDCITIPDLNEMKRKLDEYNMEIDKKKRQIKTLQNERVVYGCPACETDLQFKKGRLFVANIEPVDNLVSEEELTKHIEELSTPAHKLELNIPCEESKMRQNKKITKEIQNLKEQYENEDDLDIDLEETEEQLETYEGYYKTNSHLEMKKLKLENIIENEDFSTSYKMFQKEVLSMKEELDIDITQLSIDEDDVECDEEDLRNSIIDEEQKRATYKRTKNSIESFKKELKVYTGKIENLMNKHKFKYDGLRETEDLQDIVENFKKEISENEEKRNTAMKHIESIKLYKNYKDALTKYRNLEQKVVDLQKQEKEDKDKYTAALSFKEKVLEAESIAIQNVIESINIHAQMYLDYFFTDNPIIVKLMSFKETKKNNKPQINLEIDYKGMEADLSMLSGGELARIVLAFTLALNEMFNSPLLLLDECTASLEQDLTTKVFDAIRENFKNKTVIVVAHQVVEGVFDKIIKL